MPKVLTKAEQYASRQKRLAKDRERKMFKRKLEKEKLQLQKSFTLDVFEFEKCIKFFIWAASLVFFNYCIDFMGLLFILLTITHFSLVPVLFHERNVKVKFK